ncbi:hypothetical protein V8G54_011765 [Vigna mungo]|uniref:Uncharacterized protein n=1 Tax=Vigna mungo TaxID=3915 RepID=A0AAQ3RZX2_VIGMU
MKLYHAPIKIKAASPVKENIIITFIRHIATLTELNRDNHFQGSLILSNMSLYYFLSQLGLCFCKIESIETLPIIGLDGVKIFVSWYVDYANINHLAEKAPITWMFNLEMKKNWDFIKSLNSKIKIPNYKGCVR